jgi:hypothetical protein
MGGECSPIVADGVLYVVLRGTLYALHQGPVKVAASAK